MMKNTLKRSVIALVLVIMMALGLAANAFAAGDGLLGATASETTEIPLLIISASFDANGNGTNDYNPGDSGKLYRDPADDYYGEQWAELSADTYYDKFFGTGYSVANFYKEMTLGKLYFVPLKLDKPKDTNTKDGCINVVINQIHPSAYSKKYKGSESERQAFCRKTIDNIIAATDDFVDYSKYDKNGNGVLDSTELLIVIMNAGPSQETTGKSEGNYPRGYFAVWSTSQGTSVVVDGVRYGSAVTNMGEYTTQGKLQYTGTAAHELCHNLGAEDIYDRKVGASGAAKTPWPFVNWFSLQCSGNYSGLSDTGGRGSTPTYLDPYQRIYLGWADEVVVGEGEYTLYSTCTGKYQVLRVNTPDPDEYYLIELRLKESFERNLTEKGEGGICVWHIDETTNRAYFQSGTACSNFMFNGKYHDPGIVVCHSYNNTIYGIPSATPSSDPFFYAGAAKKHNLKFESMNYRSPLQPEDGDYGLNSYPDNWLGEKYFNLIVEPLDAPGQEMRVKITIDSRGMVAPMMNINGYDVKSTSVTASGSISADDISLAAVTEYGYMLSTKNDFSENVVRLPLAADKDTVTFENLEPSSTYYARMYITTSYGEKTSFTRMIKTLDVATESTTTEPTVEPTAAPTTEPTAAPTEEPTAAPTPTTAEPTGTTAPEKKGCGSSVLAGGAIVSVISLGTAALIRKKKER